MNAELQKRALDKVGNPHTLINLVSRRVRQLNAGSGGISRPLVDDVPTAGVADIALREILEDKITFELPEAAETAAPAPKKRRKR
jgi:DNA-directed RNA polymerase subunit omega